MKRLFSTTALITSLLAAYPLQAADIAQETGFHLDNVMGTSLDIRLVGLKKDKAAKVISKMVTELQRLEMIFNPKDAASELSRLNKTVGPFKASPEMMEVLAECEKWYDRSDHGLSCRLGGMIRIWDEAAAEQKLPDRAALRYQTFSAHKNPLGLHKKTNEVLKSKGLILDPTGLAKGYILDRVADVAHAAAPEIKGLKIDSGGDALYWGKPEGKSQWTVAVDNPLASGGAGKTLAVLSLKSKAIASSGHLARDYKIGRRSFSHILNVRDGWPVSYAPSAVVIADDAVTADALATALTVLKISDGLELIKGLSGVEALIIAPDGRHFFSKNWHEYLADEALNDEVVWRDDFRFKIDYQIPDLDKGNYEAPYVSIWITDAKKNLVRSLLLLGNHSRWMEENYIWWRRVGRKYETIVDGISHATRLPGDYQLMWDGRDDFGMIAGEGEYILHIEAAREHGAYDYKKIPLNLTQGKMVVEQERTGEIGALKIDFSPAIISQKKALNNVR